MKKGLLLIPFLAWNLHAKVIAVQDIQSDHLGPTAKASLSNLVTAQLETQLKEDRFLSWSDVQDQWNRLSLQSNTKIQANTKDVKESKNSGDSVWKCQDIKCYEKLGALLHIDQFLILDISKLDSSFVANMRLVDVSRGSTENRSFRTYKGGVDGILPLLPGMYRDVVASPEQKKRLEAEANYKKWQPLRQSLRWGGLGVLVLAGGYSVWQTLDANKKIKKYNDLPLGDPAEDGAWSDANQAVLFRNVGYGVTLLGGLGLGLSFTF